MNESELDRAKQRITQLEAELAQLKSGLRLTMTATHVAEMSSGPGGGASTISNLEEMVLLVNPDRSVGYMNAPMARLLGVSKRKDVIGDPLNRWDRAELGEGTLGALVVSALSVGQTVVVERGVPGLSAERLPDHADARPAGDPVLRFVASPMRGRVQITIQDVTRLRWLERTFSRFVSPRVIEQMIARPQEDYLEMKRREISMLYVDLRGFTRLSHSLPLAALQQMMHDYFEQMQACVERHEGTVGQFVGDEVVALFGAPISSDDHALRALFCGVDMLQAQGELRAMWLARGWPQPGIGVGVSTGEVAVGNMGTTRHMYYTALGYFMNLGARLCAAAGANEILTIPQTHGLALDAVKCLQQPGIPHLRFKSRGVFRFKNVPEPVEVLQVKAAD